MRFVTWNMNHKGQSREKRQRAWQYLADELRADLALVQEASPPEHFASVYRPIGTDTYQWGSAVVALRSGLQLRGRPRIPLADCYLTPVTGDQLPDSHPGACAVADVLDENDRRLLTAVSLYGQWEVMANGSMYSCARVHRMLSDLTGVLATSNRKSVVLAGDLNTTTQGAQSRENQAAVVFARLGAWGLVDCIAHTRESRPRLPNCTCLDGENCAHVRTYRHLGREKSDPTQWDYAFVSASLLPGFRTCEVVDTAAAWELSDHCPILLEVTTGASQ
jgi:Endonuclease/Exonuclease/phosphatase family